MSIIFSLLTGLIPILVIVAIVIAVKNRGSSGPGEEGASLTRHVWLYLLTLISLGIFAFGIGQLLSLLFEITIRSSYLAEIGSRSFNREQLSMGLAMTVIGGPLWFLFWRSIRQRIKLDPSEANAVIRKLFLILVMLVSALIWIPMTADFLKWLLAGVPAADFDSSGLAGVIVAGVLWFYHRRVSEGEGYATPINRTIRRWYVYILSGFGLVWLAVGLVAFISAAVTSLPVWGSVLVPGSFWNDTVRYAIAQAVLGGATWYYHWFRMARDDEKSILRQVYLYLLPISGGAIATLVFAATILYNLLSWLLGAATGNAGEHFLFLATAIPAILVSFAIWGYHRSLAQHEAERVQHKRESARRVYTYLMNFLGLGAGSAGLIMLFGILIELIINALSSQITPSSGWWREQLALCLALLIVGIPMWFYYWSGILKRAAMPELAEWRALSRRIFLYTVVGIAIIDLAAGLVNIVYQIISSVLESNSALTILRNSKWSLQAILVAAPLLWYHWHVLRSDQKLGAEQKVSKKAVTLLLAERTSGLAEALEQKLGYKVRRLFGSHPAPQAAAGEIPDEEISKIAGEVSSSPAEKVLLVVEGGRVLVLPYEED
jgi:hypothetical protein